MHRIPRTRAFRMRCLLSLCLAAVLLQQAQAQVTAGETLPAWSPGYLDIHKINTGKGDAALFIFPDGTTMLLDAGGPARLNDPERGVPARPDDSRRPGEWIARYVQRMLSHQESPVLDYAYLTHFHGDHMGYLLPDLPQSRSGAYRLTGITEVAEHIPIRKMIDRGWPDYAFPQPVSSPEMENYRAFLTWQIANRGLVAEQLVPGRNDQIVLVHEPARYPAFEVRNVAANVEIWTGVDANTRFHFPPLEHLPESEQPSENMCSLAIRLSYGRFDYFNGGDMPGVPPPGAPSWWDIETPVAKAVGPVEVHVVNHHGNQDAANEFLLTALRPQVHILQVWSSDHPGDTVLRRLQSTRLYPGPRDIFATNMSQANRDVIGPRLDELGSQQGHILVRVDPGGDTFRVIILDDSAETDRVIAVHGPYRSR
jgi:beta-lactamase superfamily II metal-dependent hydrolase